MVLPDGTVVGCNCVAAMDAVKDLGIGNILQASLADIWSGHSMLKLRSSFGSGALNSTCTNCDMYRNLEFYRTRDGRQRSALNQARKQGRILKTKAATAAPFSGG
jgi:radical SAM protein with 4Fe4S-binding SPASM domain